VLINNSSVSFLIVGNEMLHISHDVLILHSCHTMETHNVSKIWILTADILPVSATIFNSIDVESWTQDYLTTLVVELFSNGSSKLVGHSRVPSGTNSLGWRIFSGRSLMVISSETISIIFKVDLWNTDSCNLISMSSVW